MTRFDIHPGEQQRPDHEQHTHRQNGDAGIATEDTNPSHQQGTQHHREFTQHIVKTEKLSRLVAGNQACIKGAGQGLNAALHQTDRPPPTHRIPR